MYCATWVQVTALIPPSIEHSNILAKPTYTAIPKGISNATEAIVPVALWPSLEPSHAFAEAIKIAPTLSKDTLIVCNSCGDSAKDRDILKARLGKI